MEKEIYLLNTEKCGKCIYLTVAIENGLENPFFCIENPKDIINLPRYVLEDFMKNCPKIKRITNTTPLVDLDILKGIEKEFDLYCKIIK